MPATPTQQSYSDFHAQRAKGFTVYNVTRGHESTSSFAVASRMEAYWRDIAQNRKAVSYGEESLGNEQLLKKIAVALREKYSFTPKINQISVFPGGHFALIGIMRAVMLKHKNCHFVMQEPGYGNYIKLHAEAANSARNRHSKIVALDVDETEGKLTAEIVEKKLRAVPANKKAVLMITTPSNPQGSILTHEEMRQILRIAKKYGAQVIIDESLYGMDFRDGHPEQFQSSVKAVKGDAELTAFLKTNAFIIESGTKTAGFAGSRIASCTLPDDNEIIDHVYAYTSLLLSNTSIEAQEMMATWLTEIATGTEVKEISGYYQKNLRLLQSGLNGTGINVNSPDGGFFAVLDFSELRGMRLPDNMAKRTGITHLETDEDIYALFLNVSHNKEKVGMMRYSEFSRSKENSKDMKMRFCFGLAPDEIMAASRVITNIVDRVKAHNIQNYKPVTERFAQVTNPAEGPWATKIFGGSQWVGLSA